MSDGIFKSDAFDAGYAGEKGQATPQSFRSSIEALASQSGVPVNVLVAYVEATGTNDPTESLAVAARVAETFGPQVKAGANIEDLVIGTARDKASGQQFLERARMIGHEMYPDRVPEDPFEGEGIGSKLARRGQQFVRGANEVVASVPEAIGVRQAQEDQTQIDASRGFGQRSEGRIAGIQEQLADPNIQGEARRRLEGDLAIYQGMARNGAAQPETAAPAQDRPVFKAGQQVRDAVSGVVGEPDWRDDSFMGALSEGAGNMTGFIAGSLAAGAVGGPGAAIASGAAMGSSMGQSQQYREAIAAGADEETAQTAAQWGALIGSAEIVPIARGLKMLPPKVRSKVVDVVGKRASHILQTAGEEAAQEFLSQVAGNIVAQQLYDPERGWTEGAGEAALIGGILGGGVGALGSGDPILRERPAAEPTPEDTGPAGLLPPPALITPPPPRPDAPPPAPPSGPMGQALQDAPDFLAPGLKASDPVTIDVGGSKIAGTLRGDDGAVLEIEEDETGQVFEIPREDIEAGIAVVSPRRDDADVERAAGDEKSSLSKRAAGRVRPPNDATRDDEPKTAEEARRRANVIADHAEEAGWSSRLRDTHQALTDLAEQLDKEQAKAKAAPEKQPNVAEGRAAASSPAAPETPVASPSGPDSGAAAGDVITKKDGSPFGNLAAAKRGVKSRGLDPETVTFEEVEGGVIARPGGATIAPQEVQAASPEEAPAQPDSAVQEPEQAISQPEEPETQPEAPEAAPVEAAPVDAMPDAEIEPAPEPDQVNDDDATAWDGLNASQRESIVREAGYLERGAISPEGRKTINSDWRKLPKAARDKLTDAAVSLNDRKRPADQNPIKKPDPMPAPDERLQGDMFGGQAKTETQMADAEKARREWGAFIGIASSGKTDLWQGEIEGHQVTVRDGSRITIRGAGDAAAVLADRDVDGMSRREIAQWARGVIPKAAKEPTPGAPDAAQMQQVAQEAAPDPTDGQKEAGNYKKGHTSWNGLGLTIENAKGTERSGTAPDGSTWSVEMPAHYGYFKRTEGADGDHVDFYMGDAPESDYVVVVDQRDADTGRFDEHKVILGTSTKTEALDLYRKGFSDGRADERIKAVTEFASVEDFKAWLKDGDTTKPLANEAAPIAPNRTGDSLGEMTEQQAFEIAKRIVERGQQNTSGMNMPEGYKWSGGEWLGKNRIKNAKGKLFIEPERGLDAYYFNIADLEKELDKAKGPDFSTYRPAPDASDGSQPPSETTKDAAITQRPPRNEATIPSYGASNKLVSQDRAAELRAKLKAKLRNQLNAGIDPEIMAIGAELAVYHIEAGARRFIDLAKAIAGDLDTTPAKLRPYLRSWYNGARDMIEDHGMSIDGMDDARTVGTLVKSGVLDDLPAGNSTETPPSDTVDSDQAQETGDAGAAVRETDQGPLEEAPAGPVREPGEGGDAGLQGEAAEPERGGQGGRADGKRGDAKARGRGSRSQRAVSSAQPDLLSQAAETETVKAAKQKAAVKRALPRLRRQLDDMGLKRVRLRLDELAGRQGGFETDGAGNLAILIGESLNLGHTLHHEAMHALRAMGAFTRDEWSALTKRAKDGWLAEYDIATRYPDLSAQEQIEEAIAEAFADYAVAKERPRVPRLVRAAFDRAARVFYAVRAAFIGQNAENVFHRALSGTIAKRTGAVTPVRTGKSQATAKPDDADLMPKERGLLSQIMTDAMGGQYGLLGLVPGRALLTELTGKLPSARDYLRAKESMDTDRQRWHELTDEVAQSWRKIMRKNPDANKEMMALMHDATIAGQDPDMEFAPMATSQDKDILTGEDWRGTYAFDAATRRLKSDRSNSRAHAELKQRFDALPPEFQDMYRTVRESYKKLAKDFDEAILTNIDKSMSVALERAERTYKSDLKAIAEEGLTGDEKAAAEEEAKKKYAWAKRNNQYARKSRLASLRKQFEASRLQGPYFPLSRFGQYFVTVRDTDGNVLSFSRFESEREQQAFIKEQSGPDQVVEAGVLDDSADWKDQVDPSFVADIEAILGGTDADAAVMDQIWQRWLTSLPDFSARKRQIHRKNRAGYSHDAFRAFGRNMFHGGHQVARLRHAMDMELALDRARAEAAASDDQNRNTMVVNEMGRRHAFIMNPKGSKWAQWATSAAFVYYLGATPAAAAVNLTQTSVVGIPVLSAGFEKATAAQAAKQLGRASRDFLKGRGEAQRSKDISRDEWRAMKAAYDRGVVDKSQAHDLAGIADTGVEYSDTRMRIMGKIAWMFHQAERANREVTFLAAYRMAKAHGMGHEAAVDKAADLTWKTHFDYQNCVDGETEILTLDGWKTWDQVSPGDRIISTDDSGAAVEVSVQDVNVFHRPQEIALLSGGGPRRFSMAATDDHKAVVMKQQKKGGQRFWSAPHFVETSDLNRTHCILRAPLAPISRPSSVGADMARLIGWFVAEGWFAKNRGAKDKNNARLEQSQVKNADHVLEIDGILKRLGGAHSRHIVKNGRHVLWSFSGDIARDLKALVPQKLLRWEFLASMSAEEMEALLDAFTKADGSQRGKNGCITITQKASTNIQNLEVLQAMATALGKVASIGVSSTRDMAWLTISGNGRIKSIRTSVRRLEKTRIRVPMVWCPTTDNGRWVARRNGCVFVTGNTSRPRAMQNDGAKVLLVFRNFQIQMLWRLFRDTHQAFKGETPQARREARRQLVGITASMMLHAGITGTWGYAVLTTLLGLFFDDGRDDVEEGLQRALVETLGPDVAGLLLKGVPGHLTGVDLTSRIGMPELWFRASDRKLEGDDVYNYWLTEMVGAVPGMVENQVRGVQKIMDGEVVRGIETMAPKFIRDIIKSGRYYGEGVTTYNGDPILDEVAMHQVIIQALGFTPAQISERYDQNGRMKNKERRITDSRKNVLREATTSIIDTGQVSRAAMRSIDAWNRENPDYPITGESVKQSLSSRMRAKQRNQGGVGLNPKIDDRIRREAAPGIYN
ncbi:PLxRFG domain-containing protein [Mesobacterium pallidum]|uniref:PLxRFG domain-containing protein n=1 Tax=Mesobacterium pallidum TaxID=2872037 RepID=UPI001EE1D65A|nr:PLxRFG domain-containing protein [Mesobacterium pallidum]